jgi:UDP-N-acetylmuramate--alanine ligase
MDKRIHFIGIGGIGLSALAKFLYNNGYQISGSDIRKSEITDDLATNFKARITIPHHQDAIKNIDIIIYSAVIKDNNIEYKKAKELGIKLLSRKEALKFILKDKKVLAVAGAHGKSTTSAILSSIIPKSNALIGAISKEFNSNLRDYNNNIVIFEADESDASFLNSNPYLAIVTNVELEHMEYYNYNEKKFYNAYKEFISLSKIAILNGEDKFLSTLNNKRYKKIYPSCDIKNIEFILIDGEPYTKFNLLNYGEFKVFGFGKHIALDASLAIMGAIELGEKLEDIKSNIINYKGIKKRFDIIQNMDHITIIDDYAHHPTEIKASIDSIKIYQKLKKLSKIIAIWQPHKYSRTINNLQAFVESFNDVDELIILPIWSAGEIEIEIDLKSAFNRYNPIMADKISKENNIINIYRDNNIINQYNEGLIVGFGAGDITYQIR